MGVRKKSLQNVVQAFPIGIQRALAALFGSLYAKERYCLIARDYHASGLLKSAQYAKKRGYKQMRDSNGRNWQGLSISITG